MKTWIRFINLLLGITSVITLSGQDHRGFNYQAVARDGNGNPLSGIDISVRFSIHADTEDGVLIWQEEHDLHTSPLGLFTAVIGSAGAYNQSGEAGSFQEIDWNAGQYFLKTWIKTDQEYADLGGSLIQTVPMAMHADMASNSAGNFSVTGEEGANGSALFEVKRSDGMPVFAVYEDGVWVYSDLDQVKGKKGGFAVGGYSAATKGVVEEYMRITPDSARIYISPDDAKGKKGGFAVGGYSAGAKGTAPEYLRVTTDSTRVLVNAAAAKGKKGGFAVGGYSPATKGINDEYMCITPDSARIYINPETAKGKKGGFAVGSYSSATKGTGASFLEVHPSATRVFYDDALSTGDFESGFGVGGYSGNGYTSSDQLMSLTRDNYFIGHESGINITSDGLYNQTLGYQAGKALTTGNYNVFMGYQAGMNTSTGEWNVHLGYQAGKNCNGRNNVIIGHEACMNSAMYNSVVIGDGAAFQAGENSWGNVMIGFRTGFLTEASRNVFIGRESGYGNISGADNVYMGAFAGQMNETGGDNVYIGITAGQNGTTGAGNVYIGERAGYTNNGNWNILIGKGAGAGSGDWSTNTDFNHNIMIGLSAGYNTSTGERNLFLGNAAGYNENGSHKLYIDNTSSGTDKPLIYGDFQLKEVIIHNKLSAVDLVETSDVKLKKDIRTLDGALEMVMRLRGVSFHWDPGSEKAVSTDPSDQIGLVAQEVEQVLPELVTETSRGYKALNYGKLSAVLVEAVKEQQEMIEQQQQLIEELTRRIGELEGH